MFFSKTKKPKKGLDGVAISELLDTFDLLAYINGGKVDRHEIMVMHESIKEDQSVALQCFHKYDKIAEHFEDPKKGEILAVKNKIHSQIENGEFKNLVLQLNDLNNKICSYLSIDMHQLKIKVM